MKVRDTQTNHEGDAELWQMWMAGTTPEREEEAEVRWPRFCVFATLCTSVRVCPSCPAISSRLRA